ncbi:MAG TPA: AmmeMemoRadiSam system protein A [Thermodesulfobacteriota bacterium]|nr:AmmeMemoRadiSam system protein A [Thermodesulfobacteriota bacterium]
MPLTAKERKSLLTLARKAIESHVRGLPATDLEPEMESPALAEDCGAFVSLHKKGQLRGCIGTLVSDKPLYRTVEEMAISAASMDPRFSPLRADELKDVEIEISVLSPMREIKVIEEIEIGRHGLYVTHGSCRGLLLPQVATEHDFDSGTFLDQTCLKAGLPGGSWKKDAKVFVFEADVFKEE